MCCWASGFGMAHVSFAAARSERGSWIVGVGGPLGSATMIFDPSLLLAMVSEAHHTSYQPAHHPQTRRSKVN